MLKVTAKLVFIFHILSDVFTDINKLYYSTTCDFSKAFEMAQDLSPLDSTAYA